MANKEQLLILYRGVKDWNEWRKENPEIKPDLRGVHLIVAPFSGANFSEVNLSDTDLREANFNATQLINANLSGANLWGASLRDADLREANLSGANLNRAILGRADLRYTNLKEANLSGANLSGANLSGANLSDADLKEAYLREADLIKANLRNVDLRKANLFRAYLREANLSGANLQDANLSETDLNEKDLSGVNLSGACLAKVQALGTNFEKAKLTGACLQDWNINSATKLDDVSCDYVYLMQDQQERRPSSGNFAPGEFTKLFQKALETVDLIFRKGVNWRAFAYSFHNTQVENEGTPLAIRSIENKGDGVVLIRVAVPANSDTCKIHNDFIQGYEFAQKALESKYQASLEDKDKEINRLFYFVNQLQNQLGEVPKLMAEQPKYDQRGAKINIGSYVDTALSGSRQQGKAIQNNYAPEYKQTLAEAAAEIQQLLKQLEETNPTATEDQQIEYINDETSPSFKRRFVGALQATGEAGIDEFILENKYLKVAKAAVKGWIKPE